MNLQTDKQLQLMMLKAYNNMWRREKNPVDLGIKTNPLYLKNNTGPEVEKLFYESQKINKPK